MTRPTRVAIGSIALLAVVAFAVWQGMPVPRQTSATQPASRPAPTSRPATTAPVADAPPAPLATVLAVLQRDDPAWSAIAPLELPTDLTDAAKIVLHHPAYVDPLGNLWITHPNGRPMNEVLGQPIVDHTAVVRDRVRLVRWPPDGIPTAVVGENDHLLGVVPAGWTDVTRIFRGAVFANAVQFASGAVVPIAASSPVILLDSGPGHPVSMPALGPNEPLPGSSKPAAATRPDVPPLAFAPTLDGLFFWTVTDDPAMDAVGRFRGKQPIDLTQAAGWPKRVIEIIPLADDSVLVLHESDDGPALKLIPAPDKPPTAELIRTITPLAQQLADIDPLKRDAATRALEAQGPAAFPVLESLREQLPPEAQVRIETLLGQRFAPTLGGLRPLPGQVRTLARFPGGGCVLHFEGGGIVVGDGVGNGDGDGDSRPDRTVIPATVLIRPGLPIELIDLTAITDFVAGRQSIQWVGDQLLISDAKVGPRRWVGMTLQPPLLPKELADFDTVVSIDARRRWLLKSAKRPGDTLLLDPTLPDPTPRLPVWTVSAPGGAGRTAENWPAVRRGGDLFVLERDGWRKDKTAALPPGPSPAGSSSAEVKLDGGFTAVSTGRAIRVTDTGGQSTEVALPDSVDLPSASPAGAAPAAPSTGPVAGPGGAGADVGPAAVRLAAVGGRLFAYFYDGHVRRYAVAAGPTLKLEATFSAGVPIAAEQVWIDPAGRLVMRCGDRIAIAFPVGRVPMALRDLILRVEG